MSPPWIAPRETAEARYFVLCPNSKRRRFKSRRQVHSLVGDPRRKGKCTVMKKITDERDIIEGMRTS